MADDTDLLQEEICIEVDQPGRLGCAPLITLVANLPCADLTPILAGLFQQFAVLARVERGTVEHDSVAQDDIPQSYG